MSSPLTNLKKSKKPPPPLQPGNQRFGYVPFRHPEYSEDESKLLEEVAIEMMASKSRANTPRDPITGGLPKLRDPKASKTPAPSDLDLMSSMMSRISQLENRIQFQAKEIIEKDKKIKVLMDKIKLIEKSKDNDNSDYNKVQSLEKKCLLLQEQLQEMEGFLSDYGMVWIGEKSDPDSDVYNNEEYEEIPSTSNQGTDTSSLTMSSNNVWKPGNSVPGDAEFKVDFDAVVQHIQELNVMAGEGIAKIQHTVGGAKLKMPDPIQLTLYANGIVMFSGPFRPYTDLTTQNCMRDFMDGYFPSELQARYPDGIPFVVTDKRRVHFKTTRGINAFHGTGQMLGGETQPSRLVPSNLNKGTQCLDGDHDFEYDTEADIKGRKLTADQFLNHLPASVIKQGKVINIRESVGNSLKGQNGEKANGVTLVETDTVREMKERLSIDEKVRPPTPRNLTTLRIKSETGQSYILKMKFSDTIKDLKKWLSLQRPAGSPPYIIMSAFPNRTYEDDNATLLECGLTPNAALHLRAIK